MHSGHVQDSSRAFGLQLHPAFTSWRICADSWLYMCTNLYCREVYLDRWRPDGSAEPDRIISLDPQDPQACQYTIAAACWAAVAWAACAAVAQGQGLISRTFPGLPPRTQPVMALPACCVSIA